MQQTTSSTRLITSSAKLGVFIAIGLGTFMSALDSSVINTINPIIQSAFSTNVAATEWVSAVYLLVISGILLTFGRLGDMIGHKPFFLGGLAIFTIGSALCGSATSIEMLIATRALQAIGAAMVYANSPAILTKTFPPAQRGQALGFQATMTYLGLTAGPSLGGWLARQFSWRDVFYINVPIGILAIIAAWVFIPRNLGETKSERFDPLGATVFMAGLVALLLFMNQSHNWGWGSPLSIAVLVVSLTMLALFLWVEKHHPQPMLDLSLFSARLFSVSVICAVLNYICLYLVLFLLPYYLIHGRGFDSAQAGLLLTSQPIIMAIVAPIAGSLSDRIGSRLLSTVGLAIQALGLFLLTFLSASSPQWQIILPLAVVGLGNGIFISPNTSALMGSAPRQRQGIASGVLATARNVGMVLGVGIGGAILAFYLGEGIAADAIFTAVRLGFLISAVAALIGSLVSFQRGGTQ